MTRVQEALAVAGLEGEKADLNRVVKTSGEGWSQGQKQLVRRDSMLLPVLVIVPLPPSHRLVFRCV